MKIRNKHVYGTPEELRLVKEETDWIGRHQSYMEDENHLVILALPRKKEAKRKVRVEESEQPKRGPRREQKPKFYA